MNSEMVVCSSNNPSSTLPAWLSNDIRPSEVGEGTPPREVTALRNLSRAAPPPPFAERVAGITPLSERAGASLPDCATSHRSPFSSCSRRSLSCSSSSALRMSSARSSACRSVRLSRYSDRRLYFSTCSCRTSRSSWTVAFSSASTFRAGSSRTGVRGEGCREGNSRSVSGSAVLRAGEGGTLGLRLASESGDMAP